MVNYSSPGEIVQLALQIEINGELFYSILAKEAKDMKVRMFFEFMTRQEKKHIEIFQALLKTIAGYRPPEVLTEEYYLSVNDMAARHIFTQKDKAEIAARGAKGVIDAVDTAIRFEQESISLYESMMKIMPEKELKVIEEIIAAENNHVRLLADFRKEL
ncbi:MAG TPA: ferritin family protein [bacterium]|nr:ferritin family protein [bacterium]